LSTLGNTGNFGGDSNSPHFQPHKRLQSFLILKHSINETYYSPGTQTAKQTNSKEFLIIAQRTIKAVPVPAIQCDA
jgi:hypothetical protein